MESQNKSQEHAEELVNLKFINQDNSVKNLEKRIDDIKGYINGAFTFFALIFSGIGIGLGINYSSEKAGLRDFKNEIKADLGKSVERPNLVLYNEDNKQLLENSEVALETYKDSLGFQSVIGYIIKNEGKSSSGTMWIKTYYNDSNFCDFDQVNKVSDGEENFKYETYFNPQQLNASELPATYTTRYYLTFAIREKPMKGRYDFMIKVFYDNRFSKAKFTVVCK